MGFNGLRRGPTPVSRIRRHLLGVRRNARRNSCRGCAGRLCQRVMVVLASEAVRAPDENQILLSSAPSHPKQHRIPFACAWCPLNRKASQTPSASCGPGARQNSPGRVSSQPARRPRRTTGPE
eukprot:8451079-Pyramimonas_sp.AAC.1